MFNLFYINLVNIVQKHTQKQKICLHGTHSGPRVHLQRKFKTPVLRIVSGLHRNDLDWRVKESGFSIPLLRRFFYHTFFSWFHRHRWLTNVTLNICDNLRLNIISVL